MPWPSQAPVVPDPATLKDLPTPVAILLLCVIALLAVLFYFGTALKERLTRKPPDPAAGAPQTPPGPVATPALDRAAAVSDQYNAYLLSQIEELKSRLDEVERENRSLRNELERVRIQVYSPPRWEGRP